MLCFHITLLCHAKFKEHYWQEWRSCIIWSSLKCFFTLKRLLGRFCLGIYFTQPNSDIWKLKSYIYPSLIQPLIFLPKHPFPPWYSHFPISISSQALWDFHVEAVSLRCPRLVACVPKLHVPLGRDAYCAVVLRSSPCKGKSDKIWMWLNVAKQEALAQDSCSPQLLKQHLLALTNIGSLLRIPNVSVYLSVWTPCNSLCACPVTSAFCYITDFSLNLI